MDVAAKKTEPLKRDDMMLYSDLAHLLAGDFKQVNEYVIGSALDEFLKDLDKRLDVLHGGGVDRLRKRLGGLRATLGGIRRVSLHYAVIRREEPAGNMLGCAIFETLQGSPNPHSVSDVETDLRGIIQQYGKYLEHLLANGPKTDLKGPPPRGPGW